MHGKLSGSLNKEEIISLIAHLNHLLLDAKEVEKARSIEINGFINFHLITEVKFYAKIQIELNNYSKAFQSWAKYPSEIQEVLQNMQKCYYYLVDTNADIKKRQYQRQ